MIRADVDEVHEASSAVELSQENSGIGLRLGGFDPLKTWFDTTIFTTTFAEDSASITTHPHC